MLKAVLFDLDGTLLNRDASLSKFIASHFNSLRNVLSDVDEQQFCSRFIELDNRGYVWKDQVYRQLIKEYEIEGLTVEDLLLYYNHNFKQLCSISKLTLYAKGLKANVPNTWYYHQWKRTIPIG